MLKYETDKRWPRCQFLDEVKKNLSPGAEFLAKFNV